jgi:catechol 2,3-dioxygenase-like lactoylglutathione lyase family enzyme
MKLLILLFTGVLIMNPQPTPKRGRVIGIGGVFFKSEHPKDLQSWYQNHLGLVAEPNRGVSFEWMKDNQKRSTSWAIFPSTTKYFDPSKAPLMINYIVDDLDAILVRLKTEGVTIDPKRENDAVGKFAWVFDSDGNKIELWEPAR